MKSKLPINSIETVNFVKQYCECSVYITGGATTRCVVFCSRGFVQFPSTLHTVCKKREKRAGQPSTSRPFVLSLWCAGQWPGIYPQSRQNYFDVPKEKQTIYIALSQSKSVSSQFIGSLLFLTSAQLLYKYYHFNARCCKAKSHNIFYITHCREGGTNDTSIVEQLNENMMGAYS